MSYKVRASGSGEKLLSDMVAELDPQPSAAILLEVEVPACARLNFIDDLAQSIFSKIELRFMVREYATLTYKFREVSGFVGGDEVSSRAMSIERVLTCVLAGKGAHADMRCLYFGDAARLFKVKTHQEHAVGNTTSNVVVKAVLTDEALLICNSMISVAPGANGTNAEQVNKNILLSRKARAVSVPMLEVLANDVKCKHGAAVSRLDDEHMFYLQSRGLGVEQTKSMLLEAFLS